MPLPSHTFSRTQRWLIVAAVAVVLAAFATLVYNYERYHRPTDSLVVGIRLDPSFGEEDPIYYEFRPDHTFAVLAMIEGKKTPIDIKGKWYAGGPNIYVRFTSDIGQDRT